MLSAESVVAGQSFGTDVGSESLRVVDGENLIADSENLGEVVESENLGEGDEG